MFKGEEVSKMSKFTKGRWVVCEEKIYALSDDDSAICIAELHGDNLSERHANGILIAYAPKMYEALKAIHRELPALANSRFDGLYEVVFNAGRLLSRLNVEANVETEDAEP